MAHTHADSTIKVLITIKGGMIEELAATAHLDVTVYDKDAAAVGEDALSASYAGVYVISAKMLRDRIAELKQSVLSITQKEEAVKVLREPFRTDVGEGT